LCGTVEAIVLILLNCPMKDEFVPAWAAGAIANAATAAAPNATTEVRMMRWMEDMSQCPFPVVPNWLTLRGGYPAVASCAIAGPARSTTSGTVSAGPRFNPVAD